MKAICQQVGEVASIDEQKFNRFSRHSKFLKNTDGVFIHPDLIYKYSSGSFDEKKARLRIFEPVGVWADWYTCVCGGTVIVGRNRSLGGLVCEHYWSGEIQGEQKFIVNGTESQE